MSLWFEACFQVAWAIADHAAQTRWSAGRIFATVSCSFFCLCTVPLVFTPLVVPFRHAVAVVAAGSIGMGLLYLLIVLAGRRWPKAPRGAQ